MSLLPGIAVPLLFVAVSVPVLFSDSMLRFGAAELVNLTPVLKSIQPDEVYPKNPDTLYTFGTNWDHMTGNSLKLRQLYYRFNFTGIAVHAEGQAALGSEYPYSLKMKAMEYVKDHFDEFSKWLKRHKPAFWNHVETGATEKQLTVKHVKSGLKQVIDFETAILKSLQTMDESQLETLCQFFPSENDFDYMSPETDNNSVRNQVNGYLRSMAGIYQWKNLKFVKLSDGSEVMDHAWYFNICMLIKYKNDSYHQAINQALKVLKEVL